MKPTSRDGRTRSAKTKRKIGAIISEKYHIVKDITKSQQLAHDARKVRDAMRDAMQPVIDQMIDGGPITTYPTESEFDASDARARKKQRASRPAETMFNRARKIAASGHPVDILIPIAWQWAKLRGIIK